MTPIDFFNATGLVFWAIYFVPLMLKHQRYKLLMLCVAALLALEFYFIWPQHETARRYLAPVGIILLALAAGYIQHLYNCRTNERLPGKGDQG
jgi:hypothetical protein